MADPTFPPTRAAALDRLTGFTPRAGEDYARGRKDDVPPHGAVSTLSPYIRHRILTEAETVGRALDRPAADAADSFVSEVMWRTYFKGWLELRPGIWTAYRAGVEVARNRIATESGLRHAWEEACEGRTGIEPFDDWAAELVRTGYLHNHARMWFASIWMHALGLPWELGADFFLRHLLDGDPASNTLSWRWVAGLHTNRKPYQARAANIARYTARRYDPRVLGHQLPQGDVAALEGPEFPEPGPLAQDADWPRGGRIGLLLHEDDLHPDFILARGLEPAGTAALIAPQGRSPLTVASQVHDFTRSAAEDAVASLTRPGPVTEDSGEILRWAAGFDVIVAPHAPTGPAQTALDGTGLDMIRPLRPWDRAGWPHATAGYFRFRKRAAETLADIARGTDSESSARTDFTGS